MVYFINPIQNPNVGDIAIFYSSVKFFMDNKIEFTIINKTNYKTMDVKQDDIVVICGGGWIGIYDDSLIDFFYNIIQSTNNKAKIVIMPSSFEPLKPSFNSITKCHCVIFARDMRSYMNYKQYFKMSKVMYCSDMAFRLPKLNCRKNTKILNKSNIGIYDRNDYESLNEIKSLVSIGMAESRLNKFVQCDYKIQNAFDYISNQLYEMSKYSLIITDTLHMSIFSYLLNIPCLYFDNIYKKLNNTWSSYEQSLVQPYNQEKHINLDLYTFGNNTSIKFDYSILLNEFK